MDPIEISADELKSKLKAGGDLLLLDVRDAKELAESPGLPGAVHIPVGDILGRTHEFDPDAEIVVYCTRGQRSASVAKFLRERDSERTRSLSRGLVSWPRESA